MNNLFDPNVDYTFVENWIPFDDNIKKWIDVHSPDIKPSMGLFTLLLPLTTKLSYLDIFKFNILTPLNNVLDIITSPVINGILRKIKYKAVRSNTKQILNTTVIQTMHSRPTSSKTIFFIHGGGYFSVNGQAYTNTMEALCSALKCNIINIEYEKSGDVDAIARNTYLITTFYSNDWNDIVLMGDSSGTTIIHRILYIINRTSIAEPYHPIDVILFYPFLAEEQGLTPGRIRSLTGPTIVNLRFFRILQSRVKQVDTEYNYRNKYNKHNIITILSKTDYLYEDGKAISNIVGIPSLELPLSHGFLPLLHQYPLELQKVIQYIKLNIMNL